jgi:hypothetical protein
MTEQWVGCIEEILWPAGPRQNIWMILDGARTIEIFRMLLACHLEYASLYSGQLTPELEIAAPYLVQLDHGYRDTHQLIQQAWGNSWGVFLRSDTSLKKLRRHLRDFLVVRDTKGNRLVFRYYDPRVLRVYLPTCEATELRTFLGPIQVFWTEGQHLEDMLEFRSEGGNLVRRTIPLDSKATSEPPSAASSQDIYSEPPQRFTAVTVRPSQLAEFSRVEVQKFKNWMVVHLNKFFPTECQSAGEAQLRETIQDGINRAASYGITSKRDVCKFIDLMVVFGRYFDVDARFRWAGEILNKPGNPDWKMRSLFREAKSHLREG